MATIEIKQGESIKVTLEGTDGEFIITYGKEHLTITSDLPDSTGREGTIYDENFGTPLDDKGIDWNPEPTQETMPKLSWWCAGADDDEEEDPPPRKKKR